MAIRLIPRKKEAIYSMLSTKSSKSHYGTLGPLQSQGPRDAITALSGGLAAHICTTHDTETFAVRTLLQPRDDSNSKRMKFEDAKKGIKTLDITAANATSKRSSADSS